MEDLILDPRKLAEVSDQPLEGHLAPSEVDAQGKEEERSGKRFSGWKSSPTFDPFSKRSLVLTVLSSLLYLLDYGSDIAVAVFLKSDQASGDQTERDTRWWFTLTILFIVVPLVLVNLFSFVWFQSDYDLYRKGILPRGREVTAKEKKILITAHLLLMGPLIRDLYILHAGWKERKQRKREETTRNISGPYCLNKKSYRVIDKEKADYYTIRKYYERDSAYLGLIDGFLQDGPQLVLQLYILSVRHTESTANTSTAILQLFSVLISLLSLSVYMVIYEQANRWADPEKTKVSPFGNCFQFFWRFCMVTSRVLLLALFATIFPEELFIFGALHWLLMVYWILLMGTNFFGTSNNQRKPIAEFIYNVVIGWVYVFDIIRVKEGPSRLKQTFYYCINGIEMAVLLFLWMSEINSDDFYDPGWINERWYHITFTTIIPVLFVFGLFFQVMYYIKFHPNGKWIRKVERFSLL